KIRNCNDESRHFLSTSGKIAVTNLKKARLLSKKLACTCQRARGAFKKKPASFLKANGALCYSFLNASFQN
ncbi:MAG TPA: hypothetical protein VGA99_11480, partial [bacterium]